ncbi:hypothetical protein AAFF_G00296410 [Aldrovandia affinis]|uniref:Uncharacterized protein n=1 Tax=Aldrovandia affinis TaxID=143900 RepID=A0AAD7WRV5_9TELE|nr:hypothetical protein AAFF_G00296410 [Aldrovandia affinis]
MPWQTGEGRPFPPIVCVRAATAAASLHTADTAESRLGHRVTWHQRYAGAMHISDEIRGPGQPSCGARLGLEGRCGSREGKARLERELLAALRADSVSPADEVFPTILRWLDVAATLQPC